MVAGLRKREWLLFKNTLRHAVWRTDGYGILHETLVWNTSKSLARDSLKPLVTQLLPLWLGCAGERSLQTLFSDFLVLFD